MCQVKAWRAVLVKQQRAWGYPRWKSEFKSECFVNSEGAIEDVPRGSQSLTEATGVQASVLGRRILQGTTPQKKTKLPKKRRSDRDYPMIIVQKALKLKV